MAALNGESVTARVAERSTVVDRPADVVAAARPGASPREPASMRFAALDGLRGIAVLLVLARHASVVGDPSGGFASFVHGAMRMGWVGVDVFFALSGFLITGILVDTRGHPGYLRSFYARRSLRIFPLYFAVLAVVFFVLPFTPDGALPPFAVLQGNAAWFWTYTVNILVSIRGETSTPLYLGHLWSLSVEEQFYLFWPFVVLLVPPRFLGRVCVLLALAAVALRVGLVAATGWGSDAGYMLMPARMDALLLGGLLALLVRNPEGRRQLSRWYRPAGVVAASVLAALIVWREGLGRNDPYVQVVGYLALSVLSSALVAAALSGVREVRFVSVLRSPLLRSVGKYSYAFYVFQHPVIGFLRRTVHPLQQPWMRGSVLGNELLLFVLAGVISFAMAWVSWRVLEQPFLSLKRFFPRGDAAGA